MTVPFSCVIHINTCSGPDPQHFDTNVTREDCEIVLKLELQKTPKTMQICFGTFCSLGQNYRKIWRKSLGQDVKNEVAHTVDRASTGTLGRRRIQQLRGGEDSN